MKTRNTKQRKELLDFLKKTKGTISATDISKSLPHMDLVTIYRNLHFFAEEGSIKKMYFKGRTAYWEYQHESHHHAICKKCKKVRHFVIDEKKLKKLLNLKDFSIEDIEVTVKGRCE